MKNVKKFKNFIVKMLILKVLYKQCWYKVGKCCYQIFYMGVLYCKLIRNCVIIFVKSEKKKYFDEIYLTCVG